MRIAIVVPNLDRIRGNRMALRFAAALARTEHVEVLADRCTTEVEEEVRRLIAPAGLVCHRTVARSAAGMGGLFYGQLARGADRWIASEIERRTREERFDVVLVMSNEGHWIGPYLGRRPGTDSPITAVCVYDLLDHPFLLRRDRPNPGLRAAFGLAYPALHWVERQRLAAFDLRFTVSLWTEELLGYLYGLPTSGSLAMVDTERFQPTETGALDLPDQFIALPTASLDRRGTRLAIDLAASGLPLVAYGPGRIPSISGRGIVSDAEMVEILSRARATFFPFDYEALGLIPLESLACGTPVVTYPRGGPYRELRGNPYVSFAESQASVREACSQWLAARRDTESRQAIRRTIARYAPEEVIAAFLQALRSISPAR